VLVHALRDVPPAWRGAPVHRLGAAALRDREALTATLDVLRDAWLQRRPHVVLLDPAVRWPRILTPERERRPLWELGPGHRLLRDELVLLLGALVDARSEDPIWWPGVRARRLGCTAAPAHTQADVLLPDGRPAWIDAGPRGPIAGWPDAAARVHRESVLLLGRLDIERAAPPAEQLSAEQLAAVTHRVGAARVLAPAGSGKTRVLAARLRHLVQDRGVQPELITALAYNTRAAAELAERTRDVVVGDVRPQVRTVHALGLAVCTAALGRRPEVLDDGGVAAALVRASDGRVGAPGGPPLDAVVAALTDVRLGLRDPAEVEASRGDVPGFARLVPRYRALLHARGALDFDEQVHLAVALLLADPHLRSRVVRRSTHLLVDEAQDLTPAFVLLVRVLAGGAQQLFAVGDDDQTIYGYAGATPRVLVDLPDAYRGAASYTLSVNHRCPPAVVEAASALLAHNTVRVAKTIRAAPRRSTPLERSGGEALDVRATDSALEVIDASDGTWSAAELAPIVTAHEPDDVAVLARVGASLLAPQVALVEAGVPVRGHVGAEALARTGLRTALAYLRIATGPDRIEPADLVDTLRRPARRLAGVLPAPARPTSLARIAMRASSVDAEHRESLRRYVDDLALLATSVEAGASTAQLLAMIRDTVGLGAALDAIDRSRIRPEGSSHGDDLEALLELAALAPDPRAFPRWLAHRLARSDRGEGVTLSTVHRVKGREWDVVVLVGMRAGLVPHRLCDDVEEERRVLHVALTRARQRLILVADGARPSPFLPELLGTVRPPGSDAADEAAVLAALRRWRRGRATVDRVPAFLIAHDRTLADLARRRPTDRIALRSCHGIGPTRAERYGDELLAVISGRRVP